MATNNAANYVPVQYNAITGGANGAINNVSPSATSGNPLCSAGSSSQPVFSATPTVTSMTITGTPSAGTDATNVTYVTNALATVNPTTSVFAATTVNIPGTYTSVGSGIGDTFLTTATGAFTVDSTSPAVTSRVLFKNQSTTFQNGVYNLTTNGTGITGTLFTRAVDYNQPSDINNTGIINVLNGTAGAGTGWVINSTVVTVGVSAITFTQFVFPATTFLQVANNLSDLNSASTARTNLGLTAVATQTLTQHDVLVGGATNAITSVAPSATSGVPLISQGASSDPTFGTAVVAGGGTGNTTATAYAVQCGGTTTTGAHQSIAGLGSSGDVLTSNGAGALPTFQATSAPAVTLQTAQFTLTSAQMKALHATPVTAIAAPGAGKLIVMVGIYAKYIYAGTNVFVASAGQNVQVAFGSTTNGAITLFNVNQIAAAANVYIQAQTGANVSNGATDNQAILLYNSSGTEVTGNAAGDNTFNINFLYYVVTI